MGFFMIDLSIIIPHYNSTESLKKLLHTIPDKREIQVLVIDDNSDKEEQKNIEKLKRDFERKNVVFLKNDTGKKGAGTCRNIGMSHAQGEWLLFADADDFFVENFYQVVQKYLHSNNDVVFFKPTSIEMDTGKLSDRHVSFAELIDNYAKTKSRAAELSLRYRFDVPWSKLIKRKLIQDHSILFDEVIAANDVMFSTKVGYYLKNFEVSDETIYCVTRNKGSLTMTISNETFESRLNVYIRRYNFLKKRLNKEDFFTLQLNGRGLLLDSLQFGFKKFISVLVRLKKNQIKIFDKKLLNPVTLFKKIQLYFNKLKIQKKYSEFEE